MGFGPTPTYAQDVNGPGSDDRRDYLPRGPNTTQRRPAHVASRAATAAARGAGRGAAAGTRKLREIFGGPERMRVIVVLACVLALASADTATVGAAATTLVSRLHITLFDVGLLVGVTSVVAAIASVPFGMLADRINRTRMLAIAVSLWGIVMLGSASAGNFSGLLMWRLGLGLVSAAAGPAVASLVGDYFPSEERGKIYSYILTGELVGAGAGFAITGDIAALSWRAAFVILGLAAFPLSLALTRLSEPIRGGAGVLLAESVTRARLTGDTDGSDDYVQTVGPEEDHGWRAPSTEPTRQAVGQPKQDGFRDEPARVTDAQRLASERGISPDLNQVARARRKRMGMLSATRYVLDVKTNMALIISSACGYYFLAGVQTFGIDFVHKQYRVNLALADLLMIVIGGGAALGIIASGPLSDALLRRGVLNARVLVGAVTASATVLLFIPALITHSVVTALPYVIFAAAALSAQNPPIDAARLDIMPSMLWGRAEGIRTFLRTMAQALAPVLFGFFSDEIGLHTTFLVMLLPLSASAFFLFRAIRTYPKDVATAAAASEPLETDGGPA